MNYGKVCGEVLPINCMNITNGTIKDAVKSETKTLEDVQEQTETSTVCGICLENVQRLVNFFVNEQEN